MKSPFPRIFAALSLAVVAMSSAMYGQIIIGAGPQSTPIDAAGTGSRILIGPTIGLNRNFHSGGFRTLDEPLCPLFERGSGAGFSAGITAEYAHKSWSIIPRVTYQSRPGSFEQEMEDAMVFIPDEGIAVKQSVTAKSFVDYRLLNAEVMFKHDIVAINNKIFIALAAGPSVGYVLDGKVTQVQDLILPLNARFLNPQNLPSDGTGRRLYYADNQDIPGRKELHFSLKGGIQMELGLFNDQVMMSPGIYYDYGLSAVTGNENWGLNSMMVQVDFRHAL